MRFLEHQPRAMPEGRSGNTLSGHSVYIGLSYVRIPMFRNTVTRGRHREGAGPCDRTLAYLSTEYEQVLKREVFKTGQTSTLPDHGEFIRLSCWSSLFSASARPTWGCTQAKVAHEPTWLDSGILAGHRVQWPVWNSSTSKSEVSGGSDCILGAVWSV